MNSQSIGLIDSGLGGVTFYHALTKEFPEASFTLIVDQKNAPFGDKDKDELYTIGSNLLKKMEELNITTVLFACNTLSAMVLKELRKEFSQMNLISVIDLTVDQVPEKSNRLLVLATTATIKQQAYSKALSKKMKSAWINELATPKLVPLIEGLAEDKDIDEVLSNYLKDKTKVDTIVLGCTHYPLIKKNIKKLTKATIVDALDGAIDYFSNQNLENGPSTIYTTLDAKRLQHQIKTLFELDTEVKETNYDIVK